MKLLNIIAILVLGSATVAYAQEDTNADSEKIVKEISKSKDWSAQEISGHLAWAKEACTATTEKDNARLEIYAEKATETEYAEPTIQVLVSGLEEQVYSATLETNKGRDISLTLASQAAEKGMQVVMARLKDRAKFIDSLKRDSTVKVKLKNAKGRTIKSFRFSLRGSSKTIESQFENCGLTFNTEL